MAANDIGPIKIFPNPTSGALYLQLENLEHAKVHLRLFNTLGALVLEKRFNTDVSVFDEKLDLGRLNSGIYFLRVDIDGQATMKRIVKK